MDLQHQRHAGACQKCILVPRLNHQLASAGAAQESVILMHSKVKEALVFFILQRGFVGILLIFSIL